MINSWQPKIIRDSIERNLAHFLEVSYSCVMILDLLSKESGFKKIQHTIIIPLQHHRSICGLLSHQLLPPSQLGPSGHGLGQKLLLWWRWLWEPVKTIGTGRTIKSQCLWTQGSVLLSCVSHKSLDIDGSNITLWGGEKKRRVHCFFNTMS